MFHKEKDVDLQLKVRLERVEENVRELQDPEYAEGKRILKLEKIVNPACITTTINSGLGEIHLYSIRGRAEIARKISDYYKKLETDLLKIIKEDK